MYKVKCSLERLEDKSNLYLYYKFLLKYYKNSKVIILPTLETILRNATLFDQDATTLKDNCTNRKENDDK